MRSSLIVAAVSDNDHADVTVKGDKITLTRKAGIDPDEFAKFLDVILEFIKKLIELFGGFSEVGSSNVIPPVPVIQVGAGWTLAP